MGGKTWSSEEEKYFWEVIVPQSQQAVRPGDRLHSWDTLASMMQEAMGEPRRRDYTRTMLCMFAALPCCLFELGLNVCLLTTLV
jgi:hypothetical protein